MKTTKLIIGIILLIVGIVLYLLKTINPWYCLVIVVVGLIFVCLYFCSCKSCYGKKNLPSVTEAPAVAVTPEEVSSEPVEVASDTDKTPPVV